jgi:hypothetical protein
MAPCHENAAANEDGRPKFRECPEISGTLSVAFQIFRALKQTHLPTGADA